jgi:potassium-transporting ATPase potassium-binding subunit
VTLNGWLQVAVFVGVLLLLVKPLGLFMAHVFDGTSRVVRWGAPLERLLYRCCRVDPDVGMGWKQYAICVLAFSTLGALLLYVLQRMQAYLPWNPQHLSAITADSSFNTAISFVSNTNWQGYGGESTMSYLTQMLALSTQNFVSAATGIAVLVALIRGFRSRTATDIGNFWVDLTRSTLYVLLPLSLVLALLLVGQGVVQSFRPYQTASLMNPITVDEPVTDAAGTAVKDAQGQAVTQPVRVDTQTIPLGPAASQIAIKQLGTNGGGFFSANSAHPFENPTPLSNFLEVLAIVLIPAALCYTFGCMVGDRRQGWAILAAMLLLFVPLMGLTAWAEARGNTAYPAAVLQPGNMEGKETRFGIADSAIWAASTTAASNGSVNSMHDSYTPLGGLIPMWFMQLGEVVFGGVGSGLYGMLVFVIIAVFIAGLMVGRTPEYLGKKLQAFEMKMASLVILIPPFFSLVGTAFGVSAEAGRAAVGNNPGPHAFSEILYAFSSASNNNGSAFNGLSANNPFYNTLLGIVMWTSRFWVIVPVLAIAGSLAAKKRVPAGAGTLATHSVLFVVLLAATIVIVGALAFFPALALGPIVEELQF